VGRKIGCALKVSGSGGRGIRCQRFPGVVRRKLHVDAVWTVTFRSFPLGSLCTRCRVVQDTCGCPRSDTLRYQPKNDPCRRARGPVRSRCNRGRVSVAALGFIVLPDRAAEYAGVEGCRFRGVGARRFPRDRETVKCNGASAAFATAHAARALAPRTRTASRRLIDRESSRIRASVISQNTVQKSRLDFIHGS